MQHTDAVASLLHIYQTICENDRGEELFGHPDLDLLQQYLWTGVQFSKVPHCYLEFPLKGDPWLDLLVLHNTKEGPLLQTAEELPFFKAFQAAAGKINEDFCYGLEWDLSKGKSSLEPGFYIDHADHADLVRTVLEKLGVSNRWPAVEHFFACLPDGWTRYYIGLFPGREESPLRLGIRVNREKIDFYRERPAVLAQDFSNLGFTAFHSEMLEEILNPVYASFPWELQFDLLPDGTIGSDFGICYFFYQGAKKDAVAYYQSEPVQCVFQHLEALNLADERWKRLSECLISRPGYSFSQGKLIKVALENQFNVLKLKWQNTVLQPAKFYFESKVSELAR